MKVLPSNFLVKVSSLHFSLTVSTVIPLYLSWAPLKVSRLGEHEYLQKGIIILQKDNNLKHTVSVSHWEGYGLQLKQDRVFQIRNILQQVMDYIGTLSVVLAELNLTYFGCVCTYRNHTIAQWLKLDVLLQLILVMCCILSWRSSLCS